MPFPKSLLVLALLLSSAPAQDHRGIGPERGTRHVSPKPKPAPRRPMEARPDPRYRRWRLVTGPDQGTLIKIRGTLRDCTITIHPLAAKKVPPNTWAYLFGHEFAHLVEELGVHGKATPADELKADIAGARYAMAAGYRLDAFLGWVMTEPNQNTATHGDLHRRVQAIAKRYGIPQKAIQADARRYRDYRARH
jgi:hypothetical protein